MYAFVLARRDFRENDQIISLYTEEKGKMEVLARGVKKITSKNSAFLEPFFLVDAEIVLGKEVLRLTKVQPVNSFKNVRADLQKILMAGYAVDLLDKLLQSGEPDKNIFLLIKSFLEFLDKSADIQPIILDAFMVRLFKFLGFDILYFTGIDLAMRKKLALLAQGDWAKAASVMDKKNFLILHRAIYNFAIYHSERKLAYFSEI